jgi:hypothetical protein
VPALKVMRALRETFFPSSSNPKSKIPKSKIE